MIRVVIGMNLFFFDWPTLVLFFSAKLILLLVRDSHSSTSNSLGIRVQQE